MCAVGHRGAVAGAHRSCGDITMGHWCNTFKINIFMQFVRQELLGTGLEEEHAEVFISSLQRSTLARPDAGLAEFRKFCSILNTDKEGVRFQVH